MNGRRVLVIADGDGEMARKLVEATGGTIVIPDEFIEKPTVKVVYEYNVEPATSHPHQHRGKRRRQW